MFGHSALDRTTVLLAQYSKLSSCIGKPRSRQAEKRAFGLPARRAYKGAVSLSPNYITPAGYRRLREEYEALFGIERPRLVETISWAAGNGDRSENGDYIYGRKKLREIDRRLAWLSRRMKAAQVVDPARQEERARVLFGAKVTLADENDEQRVITLVGDDEADAGAGLVSWNSPIARAVRGAKVGDARIVRLPGGEREYEIIAIDYPSG
jgi:transcription elongation factor GreB